MDEKCFLIKTRVCGDESIDYCELTDKICTLVTESTCRIWEQIKRDEREELMKGVGG